jgi:prepilin-type N-terminal cleavage/methylation domain-containing protein
MRTVRAGTPPARARAGDDAGVSMIEVMVSMVIMSIFMAMFMGGILQVFATMYRGQSSSLAQSQVNQAFLRLDKEIRYAAGISTVGVVSGDQYVEYLTTTGGAATCTELRLDVVDEQLQYRTWDQGASPLAPTPWVPLATGLTSTAPFTFTAADATFNFQRLRLDLTSADGSGGNAVTRRTTITFTALNTSLNTSSDAVCTEGRVVP